MHVKAWVNFCFVIPTALHGSNSEVPHGGESYRTHYPADPLLSITRNIHPISRTLHERGGITGKDLYCLYYRERFVLLDIFILPKERCSGQDFKASSVS